MKLLGLLPVAAIFYFVGMEHLLTFFAYSAILTATALFFIKSFRFYVMSYFFSWLYEHPQIAKLVGIRFEDDKLWRTNRKESKVYLVGFFIELFKKFIGMDLILSDKVRKDFMKIQIPLG